MIYPASFPSNRSEPAEEKVFDCLKKLAKEYDIFYARKFSGIREGERPEYEIDFLIAHSRKGIICLEVKGGKMHYDGHTGNWHQNGRLLHKAPDVQASSATHGLMRRYVNIAKSLPIVWALCFSDCCLPQNEPLPPALLRHQIIDANDLLVLNKVLPAMFRNAQKRLPHLTGCRKNDYDRFKTELLRGMGFVRILGTTIKHDEERFVELTNFQTQLYKRALSNKRILATGPAGSGKTIIAKTLAQELADKKQHVLLTCYNTTLANKLKNDVGKEQTQICVATFHSLANRLIKKHDPMWWEQKITQPPPDFWELEVPAKFAELAEKEPPEFDAIIVDEGQDFKEFWYEALFKLLKPNARKMIFLDKMQNIFGRFEHIPDSENYFRYSLEENCRNTRNIVDFLETLTETPIKSFEKTPQGSGITLHSCKGNTHKQQLLLDDIKRLTGSEQIDTKQLLILLNGDKSESCLCNTQSIGKFPLKELTKNAFFQKNTVYYTTIDRFKGLEADVVFLLEPEKIAPEDRSRKLYTQASRAKHKLFVYEG